VQVIPAQPEKNDGNAAAKLTAYKLQNGNPEFELNTTDVVGDRSGYEVLNEQTEQEKDTADSATYLSNYEEADRNIKLEINNTLGEAPRVTPQEFGLGTFIVGEIVRSCIKCYRWRCKWVC
jgi:hypothetical protein